MTLTNDTLLSPGELVSQIDSREPIEVDCSTWAEDITPDQSSRGESNALPDSRPPITMDCPTCGEPTTLTSFE
jgi:hypothetical protein